jgi:hypothetical protein
VALEKEVKMEHKAQLVLKVREVSTALTEKRV